MSSPNNNKRKQPEPVSTEDHLKIIQNFDVDKFVKDTQQTRIDLFRLEKLYESCQLPSDIAYVNTVSQFIVTHIIEALNYVKNKGIFTMHFILPHGRINNRPKKILNNPIHYKKISALIPNIDRTISTRDNCPTVDTNYVLVYNKTGFPVTSDSISIRLHWGPK